MLQSTSAHRHITKQNRKGAEKVLHISSLTFQAGTTSRNSHQAALRIRTPTRLLTIRRHCQTIVRHGLHTNTRSRYSVTFCTPWATSLPGYGLSMLMWHILSALRGTNPAQNQAQAAEQALDHKALTVAKQKLYQAFFSCGAGTRKGFSCQHGRMVQTFST